MENTNSKNLTFRDTIDHANRIVYYISESDLINDGCIMTFTTPKLKIFGSNLIEYGDNSGLSVHDGSTFRLNVSNIDKEVSLENGYIIGTSKQSVIDEINKLFSNRIEKIVKLSRAREYLTTI